MGWQARDNQAIFGKVSVAAQIPRKIKDVSNAAEELKLLRRS
jgi:hypothetical protein